MRFIGKGLSRAFLGFIGDERKVLVGFSLAGTGAGLAND